MENETIEIKLKKWYNFSSIVALTAYILYFFAKKVDGYFWVNYIALALLIFNLIWISFTFYHIFKHKSTLQNTNKHYINNGLSLVITILFIAYMINIFRVY